jgi:hypothetical protein
MDLLDLRGDAWTICGEILSRLPGSRNASPLSFNTMRLYFGLGSVSDISR